MESATVICLWPHAVHRLRGGLALCVTAAAEAGGRVVN